MISQRFAGDIVWLTSTQEKAELLRKGVFSDNGLRSSGVLEGRADKVRTISAAPSEIIPEADIVLIAVPAFGHAPILKRIAPHLKENVLLGVLPSRSGFEFPITALLRRFSANGRIAFGLQTLPWLTRAQKVGELVRFNAQKTQVFVATIPAEASETVAAQLTDLLGVLVVPTQNFLNMTLGNMGQVIHTGLMYGHFGSWNGRTYGTDETALFYMQATDAGADAVSRMSDEVVTIAEKIQASSLDALDLSAVLHVHDWLKITYPTQTQDFSTVASCFRTGPGSGMSCPMTEVTSGRFVPNFSHRFLSEEVPFGLAVTRAIAELAGVETPGIDTVILWAQEKLGKEYLVDGKLAGRDTLELPLPQNHGVRSLRALIDWYKK